MVSPSMCCWASSLLSSTRQSSVSFEAFLPSLHTFIHTLSFLPSYTILPSDLTLQCPSHHCRHLLPSSFFLPLPPPLLFLLLFSSSSPPPPPPFALYGLSSALQYLLPAIHSVSNDLWASPSNWETVSEFDTRCSFCICCFLTTCCLCL